MIAESAAAVASLGMRARADRVASGAVSPDGLPLHDGTIAGTGDEVVTRHNDRRLTTESGSWVKNGAGMVLPASYVASHVELGYATTAHRAQGLTVDTAHALIDPATATRELLYVAVTRGASANHVYVATPAPDPFEPRVAPVTAVEALASVMARVGAAPPSGSTRGTRAGGKSPG